MNSEASATLQVLLQYFVPSGLLISSQETRRLYLGLSAVSGFCDGKHSHAVSTKLKDFHQNLLEPGESDE